MKKSPFPKKKILFKIKFATTFFFGHIAIFGVLRPPEAILKPKNVKKAEIYLSEARDMLSELLYEASGLR